VQGLPPPARTADASGELARSLATDLIEPTDAVLARVWLVGPGDQCATCPMRDECFDRTRCLHLVASAGANTRVDGPFRRFPIGARRVGQVASTRLSFVATEELPESGLAEPSWLAAHGVRSFAAFPLAIGDELLGVLALFSRREITGAEASTLEVAAGHASLAIAAMRAPTSAAATPAKRARNAARTNGDEARVADLRTLAEIEREAIERALVHTGGRVSGPRGAAMILGLKPTTLASRMLKLGVRRPPHLPKR
jgi:transcriptional regulator with GAF, ATPase, and Fis domain